MNSRAIRTASFVFALSLTAFMVQSGDVVMYLALARDFIFGAFKGDVDPYLYSLPDATLVWWHEWLGYVAFYGAWLVGGAAGLIALKMVLLGTIFYVVLRDSRGDVDAPLGLWPGLFMIGVTAASFRFVERTSLFSDLLLVYLVRRLLVATEIDRRSGLELGLLFALWAQLHPGYPLGFGLLALWVINRRAWSPWLAVPLLAPLANPDGLRGYLYPFRFALNEAVTLKLYNMEWFPSYHPAFRFAPEILAYWIFALVTLILLIRAGRPRDLRTWFVVTALAAGTQAVRFVPFAVFTSLVCVRPWSALTFVRVPRWAARLGVLALALLAARNFAFGYASSSGPRKPGFAFDPAYFPTTNLTLLRQQRIPGRLYNVHDFGSMLIWDGQSPVFHHGFVTDMDFYRTEVIGAISSVDQFLRLRDRYDWTMLLVDKRNGYRSFYAFLKDRPEWKIVGEDEASYLIYRLP